MTLRVTMLGCGGSAGVPLIGGADGRGDWGACDPGQARNRRTRSAIVLHGPGGNLLVDTSPDMRGQLLDCAVPRVDAILFTHAHADHILGLDDARILNRIAGRPLDAIGTPTTLREIEARFDYAFRPWQPPWFFRPVLQPRPVEAGSAVEAAGLSIATFDQDHGFMRSLGLRTGGFGYSTDVVSLDDAAFAALRGVDTWVVGCFQRTPHKTHAHFDLVVDWSRAVGARRTVLTHMGNDMDWDWIHAHAPAGMEAGYDGLVLNVQE